MSVRDADLLEGLLHRLATRVAYRPEISVIEWGAGRSTLWYPDYLRRLGVRVTWTSIEHDRAFVESTFTPEVSVERGVTVIRSEDLASPEEAVRVGKTVVVAGARGQLFPSSPGREHDRLADLDAYVGLGARMRHRFDVAIVDGRKRRRCLIEAERLVGTHGYVVLHDAWRTHYQCAWAAYTSGSRIGDELWVGSPRMTDFRDVLPWHAFERHADPVEQ